MHNVVAWNPRLCLGYLELSNTSILAGQLSFPKPPREESSFAAFCYVTDGILP